MLNRQVATGFPAGLTRFTDSAIFIGLLAFVYRTLAAALLQSDSYSLLYSLYGIITGSLACAMMYLLLGRFVSGFSRFNAALLFAMTPTWIFWGLASFSLASQLLLTVAGLLALLMASEKRALLPAVLSGLCLCGLLYFDDSFSVLYIVSLIYLFIRGEFRLLLAFVLPALLIYGVFLVQPGLYPHDDFVRSALGQVTLVNDAFDHYTVLRNDLDGLFEGRDAGEFTYPGFWKESRTLAGWIIFGTEFNWLARALFEPVIILYLAGLVGIQRSVRRNPSFGLLSLMGLASAIFLFFRISWNWNVNDQLLLMLIVPTYILVALGIENISGLRSTRPRERAPLENGGALVTSAEASSALRKQENARRRRRAKRRAGTMIFLLLIAVAMNIKLFKPRSDVYVPDSMRLKSSEAPPERDLSADELLKTPRR